MLADKHSIFSGFHPPVIYICWRVSHSRARSVFAVSGANTERAWLLLGVPSRYAIKGLPLSSQKWRAFRASVTWLWLHKLCSGFISKWRFAPAQKLNSRVNLRQFLGAHKLVIFVRFWRSTTPKWSAHRDESIGVKIKAPSHSLRVLVFEPLFATGSHIGRTDVRLSPNTNYRPLIYFDF